MSFPTERDNEYFLFCSLRILSKTLKLTSGWNRLISFERSVCHIGFFASGFWLFHFLRLRPRNCIFFSRSPIIGTEFYPVRSSSRVIGVHLQLMQLNCEVSIFDEKPKWRNGGKSHSVSTWNRKENRNDLSSYCHLYIKLIKSRVISSHPLNCVEKPI